MHSASFKSAFLRVFKFPKIKEGDLISCGGGGGGPLRQTGEIFGPTPPPQWRKTAELFGPSFCISVLKVSRTQILCHSLDFNAFCMIEEYFYETFKISAN